LQVAALYSTNRRGSSAAEPPCKTVRVSVARHPRARLALAWGPFWIGLTPEQKRRYLVHENASPEWSDALQIFERDGDLDLES
jgi:hypothetical protein